jgi:hypothetical protein
VLDETWREQYDRMQRSFELLKQVGEPTPKGQAVLPARDVLFHFCCDVFHLRDWIAAAVGTDKTSINQVGDQLTHDVIKPSRELSACSDVANGFKHLVLHGRSFVTGTTEGHSEVVSQGVEVSAVDKVRGTDAATFTLIESDGTVAAESVIPPSAPAPASSRVHRSDTLVIDIDGQQHDAHQVAAKAVVAWDQWLAGPSPIAVRLRQTTT